MQNNEIAQQNSESTISSSLRTQNILEHLDKQLRRPHEPAHSDFKNIIKYTLNTPEEYRVIGLTAIAEHFVNGMQLHFLALMSMFQEKAEAEEISPNECDETLNYALQKELPLLEKISKLIAIKSLDELAALNNITTSLYNLSSSETAEEAQNWLFELPHTYSRKLRQSGLLLEEQNEDREASGSSEQGNHFVKWQSSYISSESQITPEIGNTYYKVSTSMTTEAVAVPVETDDPKLVHAA